MVRYIRDLPQKVSPYVHPVYRPLLKKHPRRKLRKNRTPANSIKHRLLYRQKIPRVALYYCEVCTLNTRHYAIIRNHECSMVNESKHIISYENEVRIATMGIKSKAKDASAVMERIPNPQDVNLSYNIEPFEKFSHSLGLRIVPSLRDLCLAKIKPEEMLSPIPWEEDFERINENDIEKKKQDLQVIEKSRIMDGAAWQCNICRNLFVSFEEHDDHLAESDCIQKGLVDPIRIDPKDDTLFYRLNWKPKGAMLSHY